MSRRVGAVAVDLERRIRELERDSALSDMLLSAARRVLAHPVNPATGGRLILEVDVLTLQEVVDEIDAARK